MDAAPASRVTALLRRAVRIDDTADAGWASATLARTTGRALLLGSAGWQVVMLAIIVLSDDTRTPRAVLLAVHGAGLAMVLLARAGRVPAWTAVLALYGLFLLDWWSVDSVEDPLLFGACWVMNLCNASVAFVVLDRKGVWIPVLSALVVPVLMVLSRPDLETTLPGGVLVTQLSIVVATRVGRSFLVDLAQAADGEERRAHEEQALAATRRAASQTNAEDARVIHDTVINTLAAIASGGAATRDREAVQARCLRDVEAVREVRGDGTAAADDPRVRDVAATAPVRVRHAGVDGAALAAAEERLAPAMRILLVRAVGELLQNVAKHAGTDVATLEVAVADDHLVVTVADDGVGFDGELRPDRGLARSVVERAETAGIDVRITTAPGEGTRVTLTCPLPRGEAPSADGDVGEAVTTMRQRAAFLWAAGVAGIGLVLAATNHPGELTPEYAMVALATLGSAAAWTSVRRDGRLSGLVATLLVVAAPVAFLCTAAAVDFGHTKVVFWQAVGPTGLLVLLLEFGSRRAGAAGFVAYAATVAGTVAAQASTPDPAIVVAAAGLAGLGFAFAWDRFQLMIASIGRQAETDHRAAERARVETFERAAAERSRARWRAAGLDGAVAILRRVGDGTDDPRDDAVRDQSAEAEAYLRQLTLLHPDLIHMGLWLSEGLEAARARPVGLTVRAGGTDPDEWTARAWGALLLGSIAAVPEHSMLTVSLFPVPEGLRMTLVGPHPELGDALRAPGAGGPASRRCTVQTYGPTDVAEVELPLAELPDARTAVSVGATHS